jgi:hypothetical protein
VTRAGNGNSVRRDGPIAGIATTVEGVVQGPMAMKLKRTGRRSRCRMRRQAVEPAFGQIKQVGGTGSPCSGLNKANGEGAMISIVHNLLELARHETFRSQALGHPRRGFRLFDQPVDPVLPSEAINRSMCNVGAASPRGWRAGQKGNKLHRFCTRRCFKKDYRQRYEELTGRSLTRCPVCQRGEMLVIEVFPTTRPRRHKHPAPRPKPTDCHPFMDTS